MSWSAFLVIYSALLFKSPFVFRLWYSHLIAFHYWYANLVICMYVLALVSRHAYMALYYELPYWIFALWNINAWNLANFTRCFSLHTCIHEILMHHIFIFVSVNFVAYHPCHPALLLQFLMNCQFYFLSGRLQIILRWLTT